VTPKERRAVYYETALGALPFQEWRDSITDTRTRSTIDGRIRRLRSGNFGDSKPIGDGVSEARIFLGPGYRIYYAVHELILILLLGGDKGTQDADITRAKAYWKDHQRRVLKCKAN
jgi:putative addiction module killer protein